MFFKVYNQPYTITLHPALLSLIKETKGKGVPENLKSHEGEEGGSLRIGWDQVVGNLNRSKDKDDKKMDFSKMSAGEIWKKYVRMRAYAELKKGLMNSTLGCVWQPMEISLVEGEGKILPQSGLLEYRIRYDAVVCRPIVGEVVDAVVTKVLKNSVIFKYAVFSGMISYQRLFPEDDFVYEEIEGVGPLMKSHPDPEKIIKPGSEIRLRIIGKEFVANTGFWLIGSMNNKYLGLRKTRVPNNAEEAEVNKVEIKMELNEVDEIHGQDNSENLSRLEDSLMNFTF